jgi:hypothetical protein
MLQSDIELLPREIERFFVLDFDRCIGNTSKLHTLLEAVVANETDITPEQMQQARSMVEQSGGSFDTAQYVRDMLHASGKPDDWARVADHFIAEGRQDDMLEPGAAELLDVLEESGAPYGIVTYGGELWQTAKLLASGLEHVPYLVTTIKQKGRLLADWQILGAEGFAVPPELSPHGHIISRRLTLIDDKATSFTGLPRGADGIHVLPPAGEPLLISQRGSVPEQVRERHGLKQVIPLIKEQLSAA